ncbi:MAG: hypothetical protein JOY58_11250 [Solirubrobacterales bacterium]|nr:hypothetical protein [Solirubrobacterales bacterium]
MARAWREVYRVLAIPGWETQHELRYSDNVFDGRHYLRAAHSSVGYRRWTASWCGARS